MSDAPRMKKIQAGWAAIGPGWAVHGATRDEALEAYWRAEARHREIEARPLPADPDAQEAIATADNTAP